MSLQQSPEMVKLFEVYTAAPESIGMHLTQDTAATGAGDPLIVATGTDLAIFPGGGRDPIAQSFRVSTKVMIATFFLTDLDVAYRIIRWVSELNLSWERAMVLISGKQGRPTAGVTWSTNSICHILLGASSGKLSVDRMYVAPHAPSFTLNDPNDIESLRPLEQLYRDVWFSTQASKDLADIMFRGYPRFQPVVAPAPSITPSTRTVSELPEVHSDEDWLSLITRLRVALEDPRQLLSNCVADYAVAQLCAYSNQPARVPIPGLTGVSYSTGVAN